jgi:hypothetical protein
MADEELLFSAAKEHGSVGFNGFEWQNPLNPAHPCSYVFRTEQPWKINRSY